MSACFRGYPYFSGGFLKGKFQMKRVPEKMEESEKKKGPVAVPIRRSDGEPAAETAAEPGAGDDMAARLAKAEEEARSNYDRLLRVSAEFENYKKRSAREAEDFRKYANERLLKDLLPVIDNLERALDSALAGNCDPKSLADGVNLTLGQILKVLEGHGATPVEAAGQVFDPCRHQALMTEASPELPANSVVRELQKGYMLRDRLLRPSLVVVSTAPPADARCEADSSDPFKPEVMGY